MPRIEDETLYEIAGKGGFVDCLLDLPDEHDEKVVYIETTLARYYRTVAYRLAREFDCKREKKVNKHFVFVDRDGWMVCTSHEEIKWSCLDEYECLASACGVVTGVITHHLDKQDGVRVFEQMLKELGITVEFDCKRKKK